MASARAIGAGSATAWTTSSCSRWRPCWRASAMMWRSAMGFTIWTPRRAVAWGVRAGGTPIRCPALGTGRGVRRGPVANSHGPWPASHGDLAQHRDGPPAPPADPQSPTGGELPQPPRGPRGGRAPRRLAWPGSDIPLTAPGVRPGTTPAARGPGGVHAAGPARPGTPWATPPRFVERVTSALPPRIGYHFDVTVATEAPS